MYTPAHISDGDPLMLGVFSKNSILPNYVGTRLSVFTSSALTGNRIYYVPFFTAHGYSLARWWWQNGATVGTDYIETGIYDENFNLFRASPRTLSAGTVNQLQFATPGIHGTFVQTSSNSTDGTQYLPGLSHTMKAGVLYLMAVENSHASSAAAVSSIDSATAGYPTFTSRSTTQFNGNLNRVSIWSAVPTENWTGTLRINFGATQTGCAWAEQGFYHVDTASSDGIVQNAVGTGSSVTPLATLSAFSSAANGTFGAFGVGSNVNGTPESAAYMEFGDVVATTPPQALQTVFRPDNDTTVSETITSNPWGACAVEIKSLGTGAVYIPPMRGWLAIHCSGATATFSQNSTLPHPGQAHNLIQSSATAGLPATGTPVSASGNVRQVNWGFTRSTSP